jgi:NADH dehydrogenase
VLVNPLPRFVERLRMHQLAAGQPLAEYQIPNVIAGGGVTFLQGTATAIDADAREVAVDTPTGQRHIPYDTLVYAIGSMTDTSSVPGADEHTYTFTNAHLAQQLAARLIGHARTSTVAICGGGLTGVEAATEIAETHPDVRVVLISRDIPGAMMGDKARAYLNRALQRLGVQVRAGVSISKVLPDAVQLSDGELIHCDLRLWTTGVKVAPLATKAGIATDDRGRIVTDPTLRSVSHSSVYAVGDAAAIRQSYGVVHGTCQSGIPSGAYVAEAIDCRLRGKQPKPFRFGYWHQPVSLGRHDAVIQFTYPDDTPRRWLLTGRAAIAYKAFVTGSPLMTFRLAKHIPIPSHALAGTGGRRNPAPRPE